MPEWESKVVFQQVDPLAPAAVTALTAYFEELDARFDGGFDVHGALAEGAVGLAPPDGTMLLAADASGSILGCGGVQRHDDLTAEIKRMWIHPDARDAGLGRRLLLELERTAASLGYERVVLDTNGTLSEAIAMYARSGYHAIDRYNDNPYAQHWFAKDLGASS